MSCELAFALGLIAGVIGIIAIAYISAIGNEEDRNNE